MYMAASRISIGLFLLAGFTSSWLLGVDTLLAEEAPVVASATEAAEATVTPEQDSAYTLNTLIMFLAAVLVLLMQPGFAMLEIGLNSAKNAVNILCKNVMDLSIGMLVFFLIGFGLMYPGADYAGKWFGFRRM